METLQTFASSPESMEGLSQNEPPGSCDVSRASRLARGTVGRVGGGKRGGRDRGSNKRRELAATDSRQWDEERRDAVGRAKRERRGIEKNM